MILFFVKKGAFCFAELAYLVPSSGSGYAYLHETFSKKHRLGSVLAFLSSWISTVVVTPGIRNKTEFNV
jgi:amino acid transporter